MSFGRHVKWSLMWEISKNSFRIGAFLNSFQLRILLKKIPKRNRYTLKNSAVVSPVLLFFVSSWNSKIMANPKCESCNKTVYPLEKIPAGNKFYHKWCFKCTECQAKLDLKNFKAVSDKVYCNVHAPVDRSAQNLC
jgi:LIM domain